MIFPKKLLVIDLETTGTKPKKDYSICEIGAVLICNKTFQSMRQFESYARPLEKARMQGAMEIHGISERTLKEAPPLEHVLSRLELLVEPKSVMLASWGTTFDVDFLDIQYDKIIRIFPYKYRCVDLKSIAYWEMCRRGKKPKSWGLRSCMKKLGLIPQGRQHSALWDAKNTVMLIKYLHESR